MRYHKVSKLKDPELYYLTLLQLYMPWRDENAIIDNFPSYENKFDDVFPTIQDNILNHEPYFGVWDIDEVDLQDNSYLMNIDANDEDDDDNTSDNEYSAFDPNLHPCRLRYGSHPKDIFEPILMVLSR